MNHKRNNNNSSYIPLGSPPFRKGGFWGIFNKQLTLSSKASGQLVKFGDGRYV